MPEPLNAVLGELPDHTEPAGPFPAEVKAHARCLHPARSHAPRQVTVLAVLDRIAVVADARDVRWVERHDAILVEPDRIRWRPIADQRTRDAESRRTGQQRSKRTQATGTSTRRARPASITSQ